MLLEATQKNTRQTARKVRLVAGAIKGKPIADAIEQLAVMQRRSSLVVLKVMRQALANAQHNHGITIDQLTLKNILVDEGPTYKRFRAVSRGRAHTILKRSCHITVQLETQSKAEKAVEKVEAKPKAAEAKPKDEKKAASKPVEKPVKKAVKKSSSKTKTKEQKS